VKRAHLVILLLFLGIILANSLKIVGTIGYYALFTDNFIENFCENKEKPEMQCDGKCVLSKMLVQASDAEQTPVNLDWLKIETVLFVDSLWTLDFLKPTRLELYSTQYSNLYSFSLSQPIIHPPQI
jgi:hypothetical protein